ncbi:glycosyl hydrolase family 18 protein [Brevibacillus daliensis]|uniref:glycosyl hydrolase family 18 protein n=1 Tax=Brevibacillus daliensis TaxID=2892995 RepID=UPI001E5F49E3|nr:glycosyl hydrolase family 18 protein [Brevibacillus daliensis]
MKRILLTCMLVTVAVFGWNLTQVPAATTVKPPVEQKKKPIILGYYAENYAGDKNSYNSLKQNLSKVTDVSFSQFNVSKNGDVTGTIPADGLQLVHQAKKGSYILVTNHGEKLFDKEIVHAIVTDSAKKKKVITELVSIANKNQLTGINLDFESVPANDRDAYSRFVGELTDELHKHKKKLIVCTQAKENDDPAIFWTYGYDLNAIGKKADYVQVMTYDQHGPWSETGPVASIQWVKDVVAYSKSQVPANKLLMGIPSYGYEWSSAGNRAVTFKQMPSLLKNAPVKAVWNSPAQSPTISYKKDGVSRTIWYENEHSIRAKRQVAETNKLAGFAVWRLGFENADFWKGLAP